MAGCHIHCQMHLLPGFQTGSLDGGTSFLEHLNAIFKGWRETSFVSGQSTHAEAFQHPIRG